MDSHELLSVAEELAEVTRLLVDDDLPGTMTRYVDRIVGSVPGCRAAAITALWRDGLETVAGTWRPRGRSVDTLGPIGDALVFREPRRLPDARVDDRWPEFSAELTEAGFRSALVLPLTAPADDAAALTLLAGEPEQFGQESFDIVQLLAVHAGPALQNASLYSDCQGLVQQLRTSLRTRSLIGQAQGLLMAADDTDTTRSFALLREASQFHNVKLRIVAEQLVTAHEAGNLAAVARKYGLPAMDSEE